MVPCVDLVHLRRGREGDARGIAEVHVRTWQDAYRDLLPASFLNALSVDNRERMWRDELSVTHTDHAPWVAECGGRIIGFVSAGASRSEDARPREGEIYAIYVLPECWARGVGRNLLAHAERDLISHGYTEAILWCLADNVRSRAFYELAGWRLDGGTLTRTFAGVDVEEVRYRIALERSRFAEAI